MSGATGGGGAGRPPTPAPPPWMHAQWSGIHRSARGPFAYARSLSLSSFLSSGQDGVHLTADPFVDRVPQFQRSAVECVELWTACSVQFAGRNTERGHTVDPGPA